MKYEMNVSRDCRVVEFTRDWSYKSTSLAVQLFSFLELKNPEASVMKHVESQTTFFQDALHVHISIIKMQHHQCE